MESIEEYIPLVALIAIVAVMSVILVLGIFQLYAKKMRKKTVVKKNFRSSVVGGQIQRTKDQKGGVIAQGELREGDITDSKKFVNNVLEEMKN